MLITDFHTEIDYEEQRANRIKLADELERETKFGRTMHQLHKSKRQQQLSERLKLIKEKEKKLMQTNEQESNQTNQQSNQQSNQHKDRDSNSNEQPNNQQMNQQNQNDNQKQIEDMVQQFLQSESKKVAGIRK